MAVDGTRPCSQPYGSPAPRSPAHTLIALAPACVFLLDGITPQEIRSSFKRFPARFLPILLTPILFFLANAITADPEPGGENILLTMTRLPGGIGLVIENGCAFLAHWLLVIPLTIPWIFVRRARVQKFLLAGLLFASVLSLRVGWVAFPAIASLTRARSTSFATLSNAAIDFELALWSLAITRRPGHLLYPAALEIPAAVRTRRGHSRHAPDPRNQPRHKFCMDAPRSRYSRSHAGTPDRLFGVRDLAQTQREAVETLVTGRIIAMGQRVWIAGHWGFQWYAEEAGAEPVTRRAPLPQPGDIIVDSQADYPLFAKQWTARTVLDEVPYTGSGIGRVMDLHPPEPVSSPTASAICLGLPAPDRPPALKSGRSNRHSPSQPRL